jgi:hypothetical protein
MAWERLDVTRPLHPWEKELCMGEMQIPDSAYASADADRAMRHSTALQEAVVQLGNIIARLEKRIAVLENIELSRNQGVK